MPRPLAPGRPGFQTSVSPYSLGVHTHVAVWNIRILTGDPGSSCPVFPPFTPWVGGTVSAVVEHIPFKILVFSWMELGTPVRQLNRGSWSPVFPLPYIYNTARNASLDASTLILELSAFVTMRNKFLDFFKLFKWPSLWLSIIVTQTQTKTNSTWNPHDEHDVFASCLFQQPGSVI